MHSLSLTHAWVPHGFGTFFSTLLRSHTHSGTWGCECGHSEECVDSEHTRTAAMLENNFRSSNSLSPWHLQYTSITFPPCLPLSLSFSLLLSLSFALPFSISSSLPSWRSPSTQRDWKDKGSCSLFSSTCLISFALESVKEQLHLLFSQFLKFSSLLICQIFTPHLLFTLTVPFPLPHHLFYFLITFSCSPIHFFSPQPGGKVVLRLKCRHLCRFYTFAPLDQRHQDWRLERHPKSLD